MTLEARLQLEAQLAVQRSTPRRTVAAALLLRLDELSAICAEEIRDQLPASARLEDIDVATQAVFGSFVLALSGVPATAQLMAGVREIGESRGKRDFPLHELLRAHDIVAGVTWDAALEELTSIRAEASVLQEASMRMSVSLLECASRANTEVSEAYLGAQQAHRLTAGDARDEIVEELIDGTSLGLQALRDRADRVGYRLGDAHAVLMLNLDTANGLDETLRVLCLVLRGLSFGAPEPIVQARGTSLRAIIPVAPATSDRTVHTAVCAAIDAVELPAGAHLVGALGRVERAMPGIPMSAAQADRAFKGADATGRFGISSYADMLPILQLLHDPALARDIYRATVEPIFLHDAQHGGDLIATLDAYLEERGILAATAKRLYVHRHTLASRLERIEALCGRSLRDRDDLLMFELGMRARELVYEGESLARLVVPEGPAVASVRHLSSAAGAGRATG